MLVWQVGDVRIVRVEERVLALPPHGLLPDATPEALARHRAWLERGFLDAEGLYVFTINGFPYGAFHGQRVKEEVYLPDWRDEERLRYTDSLAWLLADLLPELVAAASSTSLPRIGKIPCVSSSSATKSRPSAISSRKPSGASTASMPLSHS